MTTTYDATSDNNVVKLTTLFQWRRFSLAKPIPRMIIWIYQKLCYYKTKSCKQVVYIFHGIYFIARDAEKTLVASHWTQGTSLVTLREAQRSNTAKLGDLKTVNPPGGVKVVGVLKLLKQLC